MVGISSLIDTWLQLRDIEVGGERTRGLYVVKSRGMGHSNQVREFVIRSDGISLVPVVVGPEGVVTGAARLSVESKARDAARTDMQLRESRQRVLERKRAMMDAQIELMRAQLAAEENGGNELDDLPSSTGAADGKRAGTKRT
jgi:circadian clock protein KaiC